MRLTLALSTLAILAALVAHAGAAEPNTLSPEEQQAGFKLLFDGKTTDGWRNYKKDTISSGWQVIDGSLTRVAKKAGDIVTTDQFDAFELLIDFKIAKGGNSGIMFHVSEEEERPWWTGPEIQIQDASQGGRKEHDPQLSGYLYDLYRSDITPAKPAGEWNSYRIIIAPEKCEVFLNGRKTVEFVLGSQDWNERVAKSKFSKYARFGKVGKGHILLQDHNDEVAFRNIKIRPIVAPNTLTKEEKAAGFKLMFDGKTLDGWRIYKKDTAGPPWKVIDGTIAILERTPGDIMTKEQYAAFELMLDYKFLTRHGNSGVLFHVTEKGKEPYHTGPEVQLFDNFPAAPQKSGWLYALYPSEIDATKPFGQWNALRIIVTPEKSEVFINGQKYYEFVKGSDDWNARVAKSKFAAMPEFGKASKGHIVLQNHGNDVVFRNIKIRELGGK